MTAKDLRAGLAAGIKDAPKHSSHPRDRFRRADEALEIELDQDEHDSAPLSLRGKQSGVARNRAATARRDTATNVVREIVSMPPSDLDLLEQLRARALADGRFISKSEMVRAGLHALAALSIGEVAQFVDRLEKRRPGRRPLPSDK